MTDRIQFYSNGIYTDRETKQQWVAERYSPILTGKVLDVGADEGHLKKYLPPDVEYAGIGLGGKNPEVITFDLEKESIPFADNSFDCVLCLDVLEHLENIHSMFDELCRVSKEWLIISLPNPWAVFMHCLQKQKYTHERNIKFYGLTPDREPDRHKWFFSSGEAKEFIRYRTEKNHFELYDAFIENEGGNGLFKAKNWTQRRKLNKIIKARRLLFRADLDFTDLYEGTSWWVLKKKNLSM